MAAEAAGLAVRVGEGRDRDDLVVGGRDAVRGGAGVVGAAATTVIPPATSRQIAWCRTSLFVMPQFRSSLPVLGDAHVHGLEQRPARVARVALGEDPVEAADVPGQQAVPVVVEDPDAPDPGARGDADDARVVVERGDRPGDVRAVAVLVAPGARGRSSRSCSRLPR